MPGEGSGGCRVLRCFGFGEVHAFDEAVGEGEDVPYLGVGENVSDEAFDELVDTNVGLAGLAVDELKGFDVGVELRPLAGPVGADLFFADGSAAL